MELESLDCNGVTVVIVIARGLIASNAAAFKQAAHKMIEANNRLIFDLGELEFVDSVGLGTLVGCLKRIRQKEGDIRICRASQSVIRIFELVKLNKVFQFFDSIDTAVASFSGK
jgi:anti-sigma B factor antagonist